MAQRGSLGPLQVLVPSLANSPTQRLSRYNIAFSPSPTPTPSPVLYQRSHQGKLWLAVLLQLSSLYAARQWLVGSPEQSVIKFAFLAFFGTSVVLGFLQRPWNGRGLSSSQWSMLLVSGGLLALSFLLRMRGLAEVGPSETILAEYVGAVVGKVLFKAQRKVHGTEDAKVRGALAFLAGLFLLSQGWTKSSCSPLSALFVPVTQTPKFASARLTRSTRITSESRAYIVEDVGMPTEKNCANYLYILAPCFAGLLSSLQKLLPSRTTLSSIPKKRLQALTYVAAGAVFIPVAFFQLLFLRASGSLDQTVLWPLVSVIAFGLVLAFYAEFFLDDKLISPLSPFHFFVTFCSLCLLELAYESNFSLLGLIVCCALLTVGVRAGEFISGSLDSNSASEKEEHYGPSLFSMVKTPLYHIWTDVKTRKIAMFLLLNTSFMVVEFVYGFLSNSLGLISDACHMLFDCAALAIGLYASYISRLPPNSKFNFGYGRFEVLSGYANAVFLILVASLIVLESLERLLEPPEISTESLLVVSVGGLLVNVVGLMFFHEAHHHAHGSAPCTHGHAHQDKVVPSSNSKGKRKLEISLAPSVIHSDVHIELHEGGYDSPIAYLQKSPPRVHTTSSPPLVDNSHGQIELHQGGQDSHITYRQKSSAGIHGNDHKLQSSSSEVHGTGAQHGHHSSHFPNGTGFSGVEHGEVHNYEHSHDHKEQLSGQHPLWKPDQNITAAQHRHGAQDNKPFLGHSHSLSKHHHHDHSEGCSHDHNHHLADNLSPGSLSPQSESHREHEHSVSCSHQDHQHGHAISHHNPGLQQSNSHGKHQHSEACSHIEGMRASPGSIQADHTDGHSHHHGGQRFSTNHEHHFEGDSGHDHGHNHSNEGDYHHHGHEGHRHDHDQNCSHEGDHHHGHEGQQHNLGHDHRHEGNHHHHGHDEHHHNHGGDHHHLDHEGHHHNHDHDQSHDGGHHHHNHDHSHSHEENHDEHSDHHHIDHNMEGIFLHILADTLGSVGVVISTILIKYKGWLFTDPACSIFISALIVSSVLPLVRNSAELLLQRVPRSAEKRIQKAMKKVGEVDGVHDWHKLHVWSYTNMELVGTLRLHATVGTDKQIVHKKVKRILQEAGIVDLTLEVEDLEH